MRNYYKEETMKVLELFSGTECLSNAFRARGHECFTVDWNEKFPSSWHTDISKITAQDILERFGKPDVIWVGTDCSSYSVASISKHRRQNPETGNLDPISDYAKFCDEMNIHVKELITEMVENYENYPSREEMVEELKSRNIGMDFDKNKMFDWDKLIKKKTKDLEKYWLAMTLQNNLGDISKIEVRCRT